MKRDKEQRELDRKAAEKAENDRRKTEELKIRKGKPKWPATTERRGGGEAAAAEVGGGGQ